MIGPQTAVVAHRQEQQDVLTTLEARSPEDDFLLAGDATAVFLQGDHTSRHGPGYGLFDRHVDERKDPTVVCADGGQLLNRPDHGGN